MSIDQILEAIEALSDEDMQRLFMKMVEAFSVELEPYPEEMKAEVRRDISHIVAEYV